MASSSSSKVVPLEMIILVGHKLRSTSSTRKEEQSCPVQLPSKSSKSGTLKFYSVDFFDSPSPNHGFLQLADPTIPITFDQVFNLFTAAYSKTLDTKKYTLKEENATEIFFNFTNKDGEREASPALVPTAGARFGSIFNSANPSACPTPCACGCDQDHHGPSVILVLHGVAWDKCRKKKENFSHTTKSYVLRYKDDTRVKLNALPHISLLSLIMKQEGLIMKAKEKASHYDNVVERHLEMQKESDKKIDELEKQVENMVIEKNETEHVKEHNSLMADQIEDLTKKAGVLTIRNEDLAEQVDAFSTLREELIKKLGILTARNEDLDEQINVLTTRNGKLLQENADLKRQVRPEATTSYFGNGKEKEQEVTHESYAKLETTNKPLTAKALDLRKQLADVKARTNVPQADSNQQVKLQALRTGGESKASSISTPSFQALWMSLRAVAYREFRTAKELKMVRMGLERMQAQLQQQQPYLAIHTATQLIQFVSTYPLSVTAIEVEGYVGRVLDGAIHQTATAGRTLPNSAIFHQNGGRNGPSSMTTTGPFDLSEFHAYPEQPPKKRKLNETVPTTEVQTIGNTKTVSATRDDNIAHPERKTALPPRGFV